MKKYKAVAFVISLLLGLCACGIRGQEITVLSREDGSGTRSAFTELTGIAEDGIDRTHARAEINNSTAVVMQTVVGNEFAIGYISLGALNESVKALAIDGVQISGETVKNGTYPLARPFLVGTLQEPGEAAQDFLCYILSDQGQAVVHEMGYVPVTGGSYESRHLSGVLRIAGSTSVAPVMEKLAESYMAVNPNMKVQIQASDSSTGLSSLTQGLCHIAMSSRGLKQSEVEKGIVPVTLCMDGIAVIVHRSNPVDNLTMAQLRGIFMGQLTDWMLLK